MSEPKEATAEDVLRVMNEVGREWAKTDEGRAFQEAALGPAIPNRVMERFMAFGLKKAERVFQLSMDEEMRRIGAPYAIAKRDRNRAKAARRKARGK